MGSSFRFVSRRSHSPVPSSFHSNLPLHFKRQVILSFLSSEGEWKGLRENEWRQIMEGAEEVNFLQGEEIVPEGNYNRFLFRILTGTVRIQKTFCAPKGSPISLSLGSLGPGEVIGEVSLLHLGVTR